MTSGRDEERERESRRIIERMKQEGESGGVSFLARTAQSVHDHVTATDADQSDRIEYWGTRIGRTIGLLAVVIIMAWFLSYLSGRG